MNESTFLSPKNITDLQECLKEKDNASSFIAGGTDILVAHRQDIACHKYIDLTKVEELTKIVIEGEKIHIGSMVTYQALCKSELAKEKLTALWQAAGSVGSQQIRNRGTIGGAIAGGMPASDIIPVLYCLEAEVELLNGSGDRRLLPVESFITGAGKTAIEANECICRFTLPLLPLKKSRFVKLGSRSQVTIAQITATLSYEEVGGVIKAPLLYIGSVDSKPVNLLIGDILAGCSIREISEEKLNTIVKRASRYIEEHTAIEFGRDYKMQAVSGVIADLLS